MPVYIAFIFLVIVVDVIIFNTLHSTGTCKFKFSEQVELELIPIRQALGADLDPDPDFAK